jgi:hypothetical protein
VLSFIFLWLGLGQVGLIVLAWGYLKRPGSVEEAADNNATEDEEE